MHPEMGFTPMSQSECATEGWEGLVGLKISCRLSVKQSYLVLAWRAATKTFHVSETYEVNAEGVWLLRTMKR